MFLYFLKYVIFRWCRKPNPETSYLHIFISDTDPSSSLSRRRRSIVKVFIPVQDEELCTEGIIKPSKGAKNAVTMFSIARQLQKPYSCNT
jgi:hypothetical protein